jgi:hypothetical protein
VQTQRVARAGPEQAAVPPLVYEATRSPGQPLDDATRADMEPRFGADFSAVRIHTDVPAQRAAAALDAAAFTLGADVFFAANTWNPTSPGGRQLLAHELAHTVQQSRGPVALQRFVSCIRARMSLEDCPSRDPGEERLSQQEPMIVEYITAPEVGYVVANFGVGRTAVKGSVRSHPNWPQLVATVSQPGSQWQLLGLSDCHGDDAMNTTIRQQRADAVRAALPTAAAAHIVGARGANLFDCLTDNTTRLDRAWNRAVLIAAERREVTIGPTTVEGERPVPKPVPQPTADCSDDQEKEVAQAKPIAIEMARKALSALSDRDDAAVKQLLRKYFNDDSPRAYDAVRQGLIKTLQGLRVRVKLECENKGSFMYGHFCPSSSTSVTTAYVRKHVGLSVHLCEAAFGRSDLSLAATLVHEFSHLFDWTDDEEYCSGGCSASLSPEDAFDNADSYARFAQEAFIKL